MVRIFSWTSRFFVSSSFFIEFFSSVTLFILSRRFCIWVCKVVVKLLALQREMPKWSTRFAWQKWQNKLVTIFSVFYLDTSAFSLTHSSARCWMRFRFASFSECRRLYSSGSESFCWATKCYKTNRKLLQKDCPKVVPQHLSIHFLKEHITLFSGSFMDWPVCEPSSACYPLPVSSSLPAASHSFHSAQCWPAAAAGCWIPVFEPWSWS